MKGSTWGPWYLLHSDFHFGIAHHQIPPPLLLNHYALCYNVAVFGITCSWEIFITAIFGHSFVEIPNTIMVRSISFLKVATQWYVQEKWLPLPSSLILCLEPGYLLPGLAPWAVASSESLVHTLPWWRVRLIIHICLSRTASLRDYRVLPLSSVQS